MSNNELSKCYINHYLQVADFGTVDYFIIGDDSAGTLFNINQNGGGVAVIGNLAADAGEYYRVSVVHQPET